MLGSLLCAQNLRLGLPGNRAAALHQIWVTLLHTISAKLQCQVQQTTLQARGQARGMQL